jgi:transposase
VSITWQCYQQLRSIYHATPAKGRQIAINVLDSFHSCPIPEVARLGRTLRAWKAEILAYFDTHDVSNGGTEVINLIIEKVRQLAHGSKTLITTGSGPCLPQTGHAPTAKAETIVRSEEPD